jgi:cyanophycin synthetase
LCDEAVSRGIPYIRLNRHSLVQLGYGVNQRRIRATIASSTGSIAVDIACDKEETKNLLGAAEIPVPKGRIVYTEEGLKDAIDSVGYPIVTKPVDGNHGKGATTNIRDWEGACIGLAAAKKIFPRRNCRKIYYRPRPPRPCHQLQIRRCSHQKTSRSKW